VTEKKTHFRKNIFPAAKGKIHFIGSPGNIPGILYIKSKELSPE